MAAVNDKDLLDQLMRREHAATVAIYDAYGVSLLDYSLILTGDADHAMTAVRDALVAIQRHAGNVGKPKHLRPWLFAMVRNSSIRIKAPLGPLAGTVVPAENPRPRQIVEAAAEGLSRKFRENLYLSIRHEFGTREIARITGGNKFLGKSRSAQSRAHLADAVAGGQLLSLGTSQCPVMAGMFERETVAVRALAAHRRRCATCYQTVLPPLNIFAVLAALPMAAPPAQLRDRIANDADDPVLVEHLASVAKPFTFNGFPAPRDQPRNNKRKLVVAMAALLAIGGGAFWAVSSAADEDTNSGSKNDRTSSTRERRATVSPTPSSTPSSSPTASPTPSPSPSKRSVPKPSKSPTPTPTPTQDPKPDPTPSQPAPSPSETTTPKPTFG
ncbi:MAG: hypothetical protein HOQ05_02975 [Corynebacteriales bacterium]|nr:hypothetical protein [Mycobacteriales bacterium]